ncbi:transcriptional regulatory protein pro-1 [Blumeria hordei DH14]|uniref:Transcriptional regulatory protein pro-1 n=1 Tax=Blumeria graminis f. sp. hordei (strain DH14) TaxID=546991 RepID=N1J7K8_BLUG1|nr:transcriptional regulatory protein pro-1 [Blumeria hordei DH14]
MVSKPSSSSKLNSSKDKMQMHRRSRTGCYTCRLRRKKCDEGLSACSACKHLGLRCEYKRPMWWSNNEQRRSQKENIKVIIKRKKLSEKSITSSSKSLNFQGQIASEYSRSWAALATCPSQFDRSRSTSIDSQMSFYNYDTCTSSSTAYKTQESSNSPQYPTIVSDCLPCEMNCEAGNEIFLNDYAHYPPTETSKLISYESDLLSHSMYLVSGKAMWDHDALEECHDSGCDDTNFQGQFNSCYDHGSSPLTFLPVNLLDDDQHLLDYFVSDVLPTIFPIPETYPHGSAHMQHVISALQSNSCFVHCCLSIAAQHYKAAMKIHDEQIDSEIIRHRYATISKLCEALSHDTDHAEILEATLGMIVFQGSVGHLDDALPDIPWDEHFRAVVSLVQKLGLHQLIRQSPDPCVVPFSMTLTTWVDILGATMKGQAPIFSELYRENLFKSPANASLGLSSVMGCDDRVLYLISEISCLEGLKRQESIDNLTLCQKVQLIGDQISWTEYGDPDLAMSLDIQEASRPQQLSKYLTSAFRLAARVYLCSLVPGFSPHQASCVGLIEKLTRILEYIPSGPQGLDRSLVWVYLICGAHSIAGSAFRDAFATRLQSLGDLAGLGSLYRTACLLREVWKLADQHPESEAGTAFPVSWRDVMERQGWGFLLI